MQWSFAPPLIYPKYVVVVVKSKKKGGGEMGRQIAEAISARRR
jgi:hypothetical protein